MANEVADEYVRTEIFLYDFLIWLKDRGYEVCDGPENTDGYPITDPETLKILCRDWVLEHGNG